MQAVVVAGISIVVAALMRGPEGLLLGLLIGTVTYATLLAVLAFRAHRDTLLVFSAKRVAQVARRYSDFPRFLLLASLVNVGARHIPTIGIAYLFGAEAAGFFLLSQRVLEAPGQVIAAAIGDVFKQQATRDFIKHGNCRKTYKNTLALLAMIGLPPLAVLILAGPSLFVWLFGESWMVSGEYTRIMAIWCFFNFLAAPLSFVYAVADRQGYNLLWQIGLLCLGVCAIIGGTLFGSPRSVIVLLTVSYSAMYLLNICYSYVFSGDGKSARSRASSYETAAKPANPLAPNVAS